MITKEKAAEYVKQVMEAADSERPVEMRLQTDERVIARVTDGIYRQPASAIRELISNSYDADSTRVIVKTDYPRFEKIVVEDDGNGMTPEVLVHVLHHIGGSAKRNHIGQELKLSSSADPARSPGGRLLIGKIGIGLFSVAQLTYKFQIITKTRGDPHRTVASIALRQYSDQPSGKDGDVFESGMVKVWRERAADVESHGTSIVLVGIRRQARDALRSSEVWDAIATNNKLPDGDERQEISPPRYHIGCVDESGEVLLGADSASPSLPWSEGDHPDVAFKKMVDSVWDQINHSNPNPQLEKLFDYYLRMIWQISLSVPIPYVDGHLFDKDVSSWANSYWIDNSPKGVAKKLSVEQGVCLGEQFGLKESDRVNQGFTVFVDELKLSRQIRYENLPASNHAIKGPVIFLGKCDEEFSGVSAEISGGPISFEAYLFWTPKVAPTEHRGVLIRINGASGTLFDPTFMRYQVAERTRLSQLTCEIFVRRGLDSALNIDRESFNSAHPHTVYITRWLYSALRQMATAHKRLASEIRAGTTDGNRRDALSKIQRIVSDTWTREIGSEGESAPTVSITPETSLKSDGDRATFQFSLDEMASRWQGEDVIGRKYWADPVRLEMARGIAEVLASFGVFDDMSRDKQQALLLAVLRVVEAGGQ